MNPLYDDLHTTILVAMHSLVFGQAGLGGDARERMLRAWYRENFAAQIEAAADAARFPPPSAIGREAEKP